MTARTGDPPPTDLSIGEFVFLMAPPRLLSDRKEGGTDSVAVSSHGLVGGVVDFRTAYAIRRPEIATGGLVSTQQSGLPREHGR